MPASRIFRLPRVEVMFIFTTIALSFTRSAFALPLDSPLFPGGIYDYIGTFTIGRPKLLINIADFFLVVGGGPAGLTVANRLSEDPSVNVLVLEAGLADHGEAFVQVPGLIGQDIGSMYDWNLSTVPQIFLDGASRSMPQGRALGGGTVINGMLWSRGGKEDYNNWVQLGNPGWSWNDLLPYFRKSETFTPVSSEALAEQFSIGDDASVHGISGPVNVSFPNYFWNSSAVLFSALNELGVPTSYDPNAGLIAGASFLPLDLDPINQTRSTARRAYYDPVADRPNLWVSTGQMATQILFANSASDSNTSTLASSASPAGQGAPPIVPGGIFGGTIIADISPNDHPVRRTLFSKLLINAKEAIFPRQTSTAATFGNHGSATSTSGSLTATGVEFAADAKSPRQTVTARREVIVAAGALHSPQLLMLSGIGPASTLTKHSVSVLADLPGVGANLQDHGQVRCWYPYYNSSYANPTELHWNRTFANEAWQAYETNRTGPLTSSAYDGVAFPALAFITDGSAAIDQSASAQWPGQYLHNETHSTVVAGFAQQLPLLVQALRDDLRAAYEIINANDGVLTVATMRPLSRGSVTLNSSQPFVPPLIDPRYGSNPIDYQILQAAIRFNERLLTTKSLSLLDPVQVSPPAGATNEQIMKYIGSQMQTEYHPVGTNAMMPLDLGGVVDPNLLVYGTSNVRVVDSSIIPLIPAAHLQAVVYAVAEKAADIIKAANANRTASASMGVSQIVSTLSSRTRSVGSTSSTGTSHVQKTVQPNAQKAPPTTLLSSPNTLSTIVSSRQVAPTTLTIVSLPTRPATSAPSTLTASTTFTPSTLAVEVVVATTTVIQTVIKTVHE